MGRMTTLWVEKKSTEAARGLPVTVQHAWAHGGPAESIRRWRQKYRAVLHMTHHNVRQQLAGNCNKQSSWLRVFPNYWSRPPKPPDHQSIF
jgi:hypothetical protein